VYDYDDLNRLTSMVSPKDGNVEAFTYDATGNRLSRQVRKLLPVPYSYPGTSHRLSAVGGAARSHDAVGNTTQVLSAATVPLSLIYNARNRLSRVDAGGALLQSNHYSGRGERVRRVVAGKERLFGYDESGRLLSDLGGGGAAGQSFIWMDDQPVAVIDGTTLRYIESDHLNTPRALIDPARNVAVWRWDLNGSAFGEHAANQDPDADGTAVTFNLRFPGQYLDAETGLHYNYFRDYEPGVGRYVESDPIGLWGGANTYAYALGSPLLFSDPRGLEVFVCCRPAQIANGLINHCWIRTDTAEAGMGIPGGGPPGEQYEGYGMQTYVTNHSKDRPTKCKKINNVNEQCVNDKITIGLPTGRFLPPWNQCQSFAYGTVNACRMGPQEPPCP